MVRQYCLSEEWFWRKRRSGTRYRDHGFSKMVVNMCWKGRGTRKKGQVLYRVCGDLALNVRPICLLIQNGALLHLSLLLLLGIRLCRRPFVDLLQRFDQLLIILFQH